MGEITELKGGKRIPAGMSATKYKTNHIYIRVSDMKDSTISTEDLHYINDFIYEKIKQYTIGKDDLYLTIAGTIGRVGEVPELFDKMNLTENALKITNIKINRKYLLVLLKSPFVQDYFESTYHQVAMPKLSLTNASKTLLPIPPIEQQKLIVEKYFLYNEKIASLDTDKSTLQLAVKQAKSKILDLAIHGKLVPQDPADEPASVLLEKLRAEKEAKIKAGELKRDKNDSYIYKSTTDNCHYQKFANGTEEEVDVPYDLPDSWRWEKIGNIFEINPKVTGDDSKNASFIPMEKISAQNKNEFSFEASNWGKIKKNHTQFKDGDVCFAKISPCFENGKAFIAKNLINGIGAGTTELIVLRNECFDKKYTFYFLANPLFIGDCCSTFNGVVGQQRIGTDIIRNYYFPVPPLNEQKRIVSKINEIYNFLDLIIKNIV